MHKRGLRGTSLLLTVCVGAFLPAAGATRARADLSPAILACRAGVARSTLKLTKAMLRAVTLCNDARDRDGAMSGTDCNDLTAADTDGSVASAQQKFVAAVSSVTGKCGGVSPSDALYPSCAAPCDSTVPSVSSFTDVATCLVCLARHEVETTSQQIHGTPASPLSTDERRCEGTVGGSGAKLFQAVVKDVTACEALDEAAGATTTDYCTTQTFPRQAVQNAAYGTGNKIVGACDLASFSNLDSCASERFSLAECVGDDVLASARRFASDAVSLSPSEATTTTTSTTTTTEEPGDPHCPDRGRLVLISHDTNVPCTSNSDCAPPRTCDTTAGICVSLSNLDSGWTGHAHHSDLDDGVITSSFLHCPGPSPVCGQCSVDGIDPTYGSCRCSNDNQKICDKPFANDNTNCGGNSCECFFGVPIPLSSAGTPACIVNRYAHDIAGTANVDDGSSEISASLRTRVYLGITTTHPCPICAGTCSNSSTTSCEVDSDCGSGNHCVQDTPNDGIRGGICIGGDNNGQTCDVTGLSPSFPARAGGVKGSGGGGYSLDCMPASNINISGAGLALNVTQTTGHVELHANLPCQGGNCQCMTCTSDPTSPCNSDSECHGANCAISANFTCTSNADCSNLDLGNCSAAAHRCTKAASISCTTNTDCKNYTQGGPCNPSTCTTFGGGVAPKPNGCLDGVCNDNGDGSAQCATGPDDHTCDGLIRANGKGILSCSTNADCTASDPNNGNCTLIDRRPCFVDPITADGIASTSFPVGASAFCVPPTANPSINAVAGLPGPARVLNQAAGSAYCASDPTVKYQPGVGGCP
ncbi:MAG TPA: hypothetical protein VGK20_16040 [Candidatus Binatia bacterium]